jgi:DNA-binding transcriptional LysR family regulator
MTRSLDLDLVRTFVAAADVGSMVAAANARHLTQGAVSQQIKRLEDSLGSALFVRDRRGLRLTAAGEKLLLKARRLLSLNDEIWSMMASGPVHGTVRLGVPYDLVGSILAPVLKGYAEVHPDVELTLVCASSPELLAALRDGTIDLAVVEERVGPTAGECLRVERLVWVGARAGNAHLRTPLPVSMVAESCAFRPVVLSALEEDGRAWRTVFESGNIEATKATVHTDLAVTAWLACTVPSDLTVLSAADGLPELPPFSISLYLAKGDAPAATTAMAALIRSAFVRQQAA